MAASIIATLLAPVLGAGVAGLFGMHGNNKNIKESRHQQAEAREMAERQFAWGQNIDQFRMWQDKESMAMAQRQQAHSLSRDRVNQINEMLRTNIDLQNSVRALWGGR